MVVIPPTIAFNPSNPGMPLLFSGVDAAVTAPIQKGLAAANKDSTHQYSPTSSIAMQMLQG
jgi:hypothetical protein